MLRYSVLEPTFDKDSALQGSREGKDLNGKDGTLTPLIKQRTEGALKGELAAHMASEDTANRKNGYSRKVMTGSAEGFELDAR